MLLAAIALITPNVAAIFPNVRMIASPWFPRNNAELRCQLHEMGLEWRVQKSQTVWVAVGDYMGERIEVEGSSANVTAKWVEAARLRDN